LTATARRFDSFEQAFALCFEEEIAGEADFATLATAEPDPRHAALVAKLARIETASAWHLRPLATALGLTPVDEAAVRRKGRVAARNRTGRPFADFMAQIVRDYPAYVEEFAQPSEPSPPEARALARLLADHEVAMIDMARIFLAGEGDPHAPLDACLAQVGRPAGDA
jgi:hypothetical protein